MTVQGGTVNQETGDHILGSGFKDEVSTAFSSSYTHYTHTGALQTTKKYEANEANGITISKRPTEDVFDDTDEQDDDDKDDDVYIVDEDYGQILATSKQVYEFLKSDETLLKQWENTVSLHRSRFQDDTFTKQGSVVKYPELFFKKENGLWYKTVLQYVTTRVAPLLDSSTSENFEQPVQVIMWKYNVNKDIFNKVYKDSELIGTDNALFENKDFKKAKALGTSTNEELLKEYERILKLEKAFYENEKSLDEKELFQLKVEDAKVKAKEASRGNVVSQIAGSLGAAAAAAFTALIPAAPAASASAAPAVAYSAAGVGAAAAAAGGTSAASAAPLSLVATVAAAPLAAAAAAGAAAAAVGGVVVSQIQQSSANSQLASARTELKEAERAAEASKVNLQEASNINARTLIENLQTSRSGRLQANTRHQLLINTLAERRRESVARRENFGNVAQQYRTIYQGRSRTESFANRTPKPKHTSKCKVYQSRSRKTGHCRNKSRKSPCKSGKTRKGTGRCHKPKV